MAKKHFCIVIVGTVALCAGCNVYPAWAAVLVGALSGPLFIVCNYLLIRCKVSQNEVLYCFVLPPKKTFFVF